MGDQNLELATNENNQKKLEASYKIITIKASNLTHSQFNIVIGAFLNKLKYGSKFFKMMDRDSYFKNYPVYIKSLLLRPEAKVRFAMLPDQDEDVSIGWCLFEGKTVHFVFVKEEVRRNGIAASLVPKDFDTVTHLTNIGLSILTKHKDVRYDPWA